MENKMDRPYVISHMVNSIDGKSTGKWMADPKIAKTIQRVFLEHKQFNTQAFGVGKSAGLEFTSKEPADLTKYAGKSIPYEDYINPQIKNKYYCFTFDRKGSLWFTTNVLNIKFAPWYSGAHHVQVLTEQAKPEYLAYLQDMGVSYIFGGKEDICIKDVLKKIKEKFGIDKFILEGGPTISGAFLREGMIDEISLFIASITASPGEMSTFSEQGCVQHFKLAKCEVVLEDNYVYLTYKKDE